jgi:hypothetical protein
LYRVLLPGLAPGRTNRQPVHHAGYHHNLPGDQLAIVRWHAFQTDRRGRAFGIAAAAIPGQGAGFGAATCDKIRRPGDGRAVAGASGVKTHQDERGAELWRWLDRGAHFYVCGDAERIAKDVDIVLRMVVSQHGGFSEDDADAYVNRMAQEKRYVRDVY